MIFRRCVCVVSFILLSLYVPTVLRADSSASKTLILISVDGLSPEALRKAQAPNIKSWARAGVTAPNARAVLPAITITNHASMVAGVGPARHQMVANFEWCNEISVPTLFDLGRRLGQRTAMIAAKSKLKCIVNESQLNHFRILNRHSAEAVALEAVRTLDSIAPQFLFVHFGDVDWAGHKYGWESSQQIAAIERVDQALGTLFQAVYQRAEISARTTIILTSDHGGQGRSHFVSERDQSIVWYAVGPTIPAGSVIQGRLNAADTAAMAASYMGWPIPREWGWTGTTHPIGLRARYASQ